MPFDLKFDPISQDEIDDGAGSPQLTENADTAVQLAMLIHYQEAWQDPEMGSRFHKLSLFQSDPEKLGAEEARRVLRGLEERGRIIVDSVTAEVPSPGRLVVATRFQDATTGKIVDTKVRTGGR